MSEYERRKSELKKGSLIRLLVFALPVTVLWFIDLGDPGFIQRVLSPEILITYFMIVSFVSWKYRKSLKCPECEGDLIRTFDYKHVQKRFCPHCGFHLEPNLPQENLKKSFYNPKARPKFIATIFGMGAGLAYYGYTHDYQQLLLVGLAIAGFTVFPIITNLARHCRSCGNIVGLSDKFCSHCGEKVPSRK